MNKIRDHKSSPVLILHYADWCGHCTTFKDKQSGVWEKVKQRLKKDKSIGVVEIEHQEMATLPKKFHVAAFPMLKLFVNGTDKPGVEYDGMDRSLESILAFVQRYSPNRQSPSASKTRSKSTRSVEK